MAQPTTTLPALSGGDARDWQYEYTAWRDAGFTAAHATRKAYKRVGVDVDAYNPVERAAVNAERDREARELMEHDTHGTCGGCFEPVTRCDCS